MMYGNIFQNTFHHTMWKVSKWWSYLKRYFYKQKRIRWPIHKTFVINLKSRKDRYRALKREAKHLKLINGTLWDKIEVVEGIDGRKLKQKKNKDYIPTYRFDYHFQVDPHPVWLHRLNNGTYKRGEISHASDPEVGVANSHIKIWKNIVKKNIQSSLILEDDFYFEPYFQERFMDVMREAPDNWDIIYLSKLPSRYGFTWDPHSDQLIRVYNGVWWLSGYLLSLNGAKKLMKGFPVRGAVDCWINYQLRKMNAYSTKWNLIEQRWFDKSNNIYSFEKKYVVKSF